MDETECTGTDSDESGGEARPCPWCGRPVEPGRAACRACGFDFEHMDAAAPPPEELETAAEGGAGEGEEGEEPGGDAPPEALSVACFECGEINHRDADFCRRCGAAIGPYSTVKPFERAMAMGKFVRRALEDRRKADTWTARGWLWSLVILIVLVVIYLFMAG